MKATFVGCANSGKTTTAAMVFSELKRNGMVSEFISEQARVYIARMRLRHPEFYPDDWDQLQIMRLQQELITVMENSTIQADAIVVCDSSPLNSLLYMSPKARECYEVQQLIKEFNENPGLVFYCPPVPRNYSVDPNRLHTEEKSMEIDQSIPEVMNALVPNIWANHIPLAGQPQDRYVMAISEVLKERIRRSS